MGPARRLGAPALGLWIIALAGAAPAEGPELERRVQALAEQNRALQETVRRLENEVQAARDEARAAESLARRRETTPVSSGAAGGLPSRSVGRVNLQLLDVSLDILAAAGGSSAVDAELELLQGGEHDPRQRGFTMQQAELSLLGAVDPFFRGEAHVHYFLDAEGETVVELEEAFLTTQQLPFGLAEAGLQLQVGHFFTEFGRLNTQHPHAWHWQDQPVILSRLFGGDGMRGPGFRLGWLTPLPWYSELHVGAQTAKGETMVSFLANDEVFAERPPGGRPFAEEGTHSPNDLVQLVRWVNGFDLSDTWSAQLGASFLHGPNATGPDGRTLIYGADVVAKWRPLQTDRGWPFVVLEGEVMRRRYHADDFFGCPVEQSACESGAVAEAFVGDETLRDWGAYVQTLWGFHRNWATGLRYEYASGSGANVEGSETGFEPVSRSGDPFRSVRHRVSPLLVFHPSEFSRLRLQYNYDRASFLADEDVHSVWAGFEILFGSHPAHAY